MMRHSPKFSGPPVASCGFLSLAAIVFCMAALGSYAETSDDEFADLKSENAALRQQIVDLQEELSALRAQLAELSEDNDELETQAQQLENQTVELEAQTQELQELAGISTDGRIEAEQSTRIKAVADPDTQQTVVSFGPEPLDVQGSPGDVYFSVVFRHPKNDTPALVEKVEFYILTSHTGRHFKGRDEVAFTVDGERREMTPADYEVNARRSGMPGKPRMDRSDERVVFYLDRPTFQSLSEAVTLTVRRGTLELTFDRDDLAALRALQRRLDGSSASPE